MGHGEHAHRVVRMGPEMLVSVAVAADWDSGGREGRIERTADSGPFLRAEPWPPGVPEGQRGWALPGYCRVANRDCRANLEDSWGNLQSRGETESERVGLPS